MQLAKGLLKVAVERGGFIKRVAFTENVWISFEPRPSGDQLQRFQIDNYEHAGLSR